MAASNVEKEQKEKELKEQKEREQKDKERESQAQFHQQQIRNMMRTKTNAYMGLTLNTHLPGHDHTGPLSHPHPHPHSHFLQNNVHHGPISHHPNTGPAGTFLHTETPILHETHSIQEVEPNPNCMVDNLTNQTGRSLRKSVYSYKAPTILTQKTKLKGIGDALNEVWYDTGVKIKDLGEGEGFGEKALESKAGIRTSSILVAQNCEFIIINKEDYLNIIKKHDKGRQAKLAFLKEYVPFLGRINSPDIFEDIFFLFKEKDFNRDTYIVEENQSGNEIFFVFNGYVTLEKTFSIPPAYDPEHPVAIKKTIATIGPGSAAGEEVIENGVYKYAIKAASRIVTVYSIETNNLRYRLPPESYKLIMENFESKEKFHIENENKAHLEAKISVLGQKKDPLIDNNSLLKLVMPSSKSKVIHHMKKPIRQSASVLPNLPSPRNQTFNMDNTEKREPIDIKASIEQEKMKYMIAPFTRGNFAGSPTAQLKRTHTMLEEIQFRNAKNGVESVRKGGTDYPVFDLKTISDIHNKSKTDLEIPKNEFISVKDLAENLRNERFDFGDTPSSKYTQKINEIRRQRTEINFQKKPELPLPRTNRLLKKLYTFIGEGSTSRTLETQESMESYPLSILPGDITSARLFTGKLNESKDMSDKKLFTPDVMSPKNAFKQATPSTLRITTFDGSQIDDTSKDSISPKSSTAALYKLLGRTRNPNSIREKKRLQDSLNADKKKEKFKHYFPRVNRTGILTDEAEISKTSISGHFGLKVKPY